MRKISITGLEARNKFIAGAKYLSTAIGSTLGPFGHNAFLEHNHKITNDGFAISAELAGTLVDEFERQGALTLHEASSKQNDEVGDSTTSVQILTHAIVEESLRFLPSEKSIIAKKKPSEIAAMIETSKVKVLELLKAKATPVATEEELIQAAKVSVDNDELAKMIGETQYKIGKDGFIILEETNEPTCSIEVVKGIRIDNGFGTPVVITNQAEQSLELKSIHILLTNYTLQKEDIVRLKSKIINPMVAEKKMGLIIMARAFSPEAIQFCIQSMNAGFSIFPLNAPYEYQTEIMKDLAAITGATYYDVEEKSLEDLSIEDIGFVTGLRARRFDAIVTGPQDETKVIVQDAINKRTKELEEKLNGNAVSDFERKRLQARIAQFKGGFAILKVGAETVIQRKYLKDKAEDAVNSVRLALQGGTVKGAGLALKEIADELPDGDILKKPLQAINNQITISAPEGFVIEPWVRDPYPTLVACINNACSVASQFATINMVVATENPKECSCSNGQQHPQQPQMM